MYFATSIMQVDWSKWHYIDWPPIHYIITQFYNAQNQMPLNTADTREWRCIENANHSILFTVSLPQVPNTSDIKYNTKQFKLSWLLWNPLSHWQKMDTTNPSIIHFIQATSNANPETVPSSDIQIIVGFLSHLFKIIIGDPNLNAA